MSDPLGYLITWTTYGTWLHGDKRGWVKSGKAGIQQPDWQRKQHTRRKMAAPPVLLSDEQRNIVQKTVESHCVIRKWRLYAVNVRTNHVHLVVTAPVDPETMMNQLKAWCSRRLNEQIRNQTIPARSASKGPSKWWTEHGSTKWINDEVYLQNAIQYVLEGQ